MSEPREAALDPAVAEVLRALDMAVVEWLADGSFVPLAGTPRWFRGATPWGSMPFLEHFVDEARRFLHDNGAGVLPSDPFTVVAADGSELLLRARALKVKGRVVMAIERLEGAADVRPILRQAREDALDHEQFADKARALHAPIDDMARAVAEARQALPPGSAVSVSLARAIGTLREVAASLPAPRRRR